MLAVRTENTKKTDIQTNVWNEMCKNDSRARAKKKEEICFCANHFSALALARREKKKVLCLLVGVHGLTLYVLLMTR